MAATEGGVAAQLGTGVRDLRGELEVTEKLTDDEADVLADSIRCSSLVEVVVVMSDCGEAGSIALLAAIEGSETVEAAYIDFDGVRRAVGMGADVGRTCCSRTPLYVASRAGYDEVVRFLAQQGANVDAANSDGATPLYTACCWGHIGVVRLLAECGAKLDAAMNIGATPLIVASQNGHYEVVRFLAESGANVDAAMSDGATALFIASQKGHYEVVRFLAESRANLEAAMSDGATPLIIAINRGHYEVVQQLVASGARRFGREDVVDAAFGRGGELLAAVKRGVVSARDPDGNDPDRKYKIGMKHRGSRWALFGAGPLDDKLEGLVWLRMASLDGHIRAKGENETLCREADGNLVCGDVIGSGAFGKVWKGQLWGKPVAVKRANNVGLADLENEIRRLGVLPPHENVVQFYYGGDMDRRAQLVMEFVEGGNAFGVLGGAAARRREVAIGTARGMAHLHRNNVAHLDLKPENVLVGKDGSVKVTDFGMAQQMELREDGSVSVNALVFDGGTFEFMDPAIYITEDQRIIPNRADVYAFGFMLFELVTGQRARYSEWTGVGRIPADVWKNLRVLARLNDLVTLLRDIHDHEYGPIIPTTVPPELASLIRDCWHADYHKRPAFSEIITRLEKCTFP